MTPSEMGEEEFAKVLAFIYRVAGIRIPATKRVMISNRLRPRLKATGIETFPAYYTFLTSLAGKAETPFFLDAITTNETYFFRDPQHYEWIGDTFLPEIAHQAMLKKRPKSLRIWSAACSTGEEPYSVAIKILGKRAKFTGWTIRLLGTDLSGAALKRAREARYDVRALRLVSAEDRQTFFEHDAALQKWTVKPEVRALPSWKLHNLLQPIPEETFDCVILKNVLIYFDPVSKQTALNHLLKSISPGGYLVVGPTEGIYTMLGSLIRHKTWLYQRPE